MLKRTLAILLCICMMLSLVACGGGKQEEPVFEDIIIEQPDDSDHDYDYSDDVDEDAFVDDYDNWFDEDNDKTGLVKAENKFDEDSNAYSLIKEMQGKFKYISNGKSDISFVADGKWYISSYFDEVLEMADGIPSDAQFWYFTNMTIGDNLLCYFDGALRNYTDSYEAGFIGVKFNPETDAILGMDVGTGLYVLRKTDNGNVLEYWDAIQDENSRYIQNDDGTYSYVATKTGVIGDFVLSRAEWTGYRLEEPVVDIAFVDTLENGRSVYCITESGDVYLAIDGAITPRDGTYLKLSTSTPITTNVDKIFNSDVYMTSSPIHSKAGNATAVYTSGHGESLLDKEDDVEIAIRMPSDHTTADIVDVFACGTGAAFVFSNGDVYVAAEIDTEVGGECEMVKIDELSDWNQDGKIKMMAASTSMFDVYIYAMTNDGELYAYCVDDLF